ncbi:Gfo/Idh/MocA family protein [Streptomyces sp. NBC_01618]|uniref:Gfo/Idh/MocA family protein n=1 Tax=Streptomyces sp. NBC_01618 TaxID=2975900 RepID=UPI00386AD519|nr:Gfo/Idh/MocA family oxidoreductase [Streptomyces sp. NBC_01618]
MSMRRIGIIGTENSHVDQFVRFLNLEERHPENRAVALVGGRTERNKALCRTGSIDLVVEDPADLVGHVDAVIVSSRDGRTHREQAEPLLEAGLPVFVDKPFAGSVADAQALIAAAERSRATVVSGSALRFVPGISSLTDEAGHCGALRQVAMTGPADPDSEYAGLFFYGIHQVEAALQLLGDPVVEPGSLTTTATRHGDTVVALTRIGDVSLTFTFVTPADGEQTSFHATVTGTGGVRAAALTLPADYAAPPLARFVEACDRNEPQKDRSSVLSPIVVLGSVTDALAAAQGKD